MTPDELSERLNGLVRDVQTEVAGIVREALAEPKPAPVDGKFGEWCKFCHHPDDGKGLVQQLAATRETVLILTDNLLAERELYRVDMERKDKEIAGLKGMLGEMTKDTMDVATLRAQLEMTQRDSRKEISDLKGAVASLRMSKDQWKSQARKHGERVRELETGIADRDKTITGLRRIQDMLIRNTPAPIDRQPGQG